MAQWMNAVGPAILFVGMLASHALAGEPRLLRPGQYHGHEVTAVSGESWLALVRDAGGRDRLAPVTLRVDTVRDEMVDDDGPATGKLVSAAPGGDAILFLVKGINGMRAAGDLDGDRALDLLIDLTDHYNVSRPTLFLSRGRRAGTLLERVATHESVGC